MHIIEHRGPGRYLRACIVGGIALVRDEYRALHPVAGEEVDGHPVDDLPVVDLNGLALPGHRPARAGCLECRCHQLATFPIASWILFMVAHCAGPVVLM